MSQEQAPEQEFTIVLPQSVLQTVLGALEELPHKVSRRAIDLIINQANKQPEEPVAE